MFLSGRLGGHRHRCVSVLAGGDQSGCSCALDRGGARCIVQATRTQQGVALRLEGVRI